MRTVNARNLLIVVGILVVLAGVLADAFGVGQNPRFGWKQGIAVAVGLALVTGAALWGRSR